jgi:membrane-bound lytic murein transglycosylase D
LAASRQQPASNADFSLAALAASVAPQPETAATPKKAAAISTAGRKKLMHTVASGDVLGSIAEAYNVGVSELRRWNNLRGNSIRAGQRIAVWVQQHAASQSKQHMALAKSAKSLPVARENSIGKIGKTSFADTPRGGVYEVQPGDTLWSISKNQGIPVEKLKKLNKLKSNNLQAGQKLIVG